MRLYIWDKVLRDYDYGVAFAIANSAQEARQVILDSCEDWAREGLESDLQWINHPFGWAKAEPNPPRVIELDQPFGLAHHGGG